MLCDDKYQSVVLVGHGSYNHWRATDNEVGINDIKRLKGKFKQKTGEWLQLTCAVREFSDLHLGEQFMENGRFFANNGEVGTLNLVVDALIPFWRIKAVTAERRNAHF